MRVPVILEEERRMRKGGEKREWENEEGMGREGREGDRR
jgi:hypothetical protein